MITRMEALSTQPGASYLPLGGFMPNDDPVQVRTIEGLAPVKAEIASAPFASGRGELFQGSSTGKRNIVLNLGLNPNWTNQTMASLRQLLYQYFIPEQWVTLRFYSDDLPVVYINGTTESFEPDIFSEDPELQISIICPKPDFIDVDATYISGEAGGSLGDIVTEIDYKGNAPVGFVLNVLHGDDSVPYTGNIGIVNASGSNQQEFELHSVEIDTTRFLQVSTTRTSRYVHSVRASDSEAIDILAKLYTSSDWPELKPGVNNFQVVYDPLSFGAHPPLKWQMGYYNRFGGL